jgi:hypothetical protein
MMATSENESQWLQSAFIEDRMAVQMENIQDRQFLRTGVRPTAGQRVELKIFIHPSFLAPSTAVSTNRNGADKDKDKGDNGGVVWCGFSGQVTRVACEPAKWFPKSHSSDKRGSKILSFFLGTKVFCLPTIDSATTKKLLPNSHFSPCISCDEKDCKGGELFLPQQDWEDLQDKTKMDLSFPMNLLGGVKHGQEVVCEGRLNFDHDSTYLFLKHKITLFVACCWTTCLILFVSSFLALLPFQISVSAPWSRRGSLERRPSI